jgi:hypothetical protein
MSQNKGSRDNTASLEATECLFIKVLFSRPGEVQRPTLHHALSEWRRILLGARRVQAETADHEQCRSQKAEAISGSPPKP